MSESDLQRAVVDLARTLGWRVAHFRPAQVRAGRYATPVAYDGAGWPDLVLVRRERIVFAELKTAKGRTSAAQDAWLDALGQTGAEVRLWRPAHWLEGRIAADLQARGRGVRVEVTEATT